MENSTESSGTRKAVLYVDLLSSHTTPPAVNKFTKVI